MKNTNIKSIAKNFPELLLEWDYDLNEKLPDEVSYGSRYDAKWVCLSGHKYNQLVLNKTLGKQGCPYCSGSRVLVGVTDISTTHPEIAREWSDLNSTSVQNFSRGSDYVAIWVGKECGHTYRSRISRRVAGHGCGVCTGHQVVPGVNDLLSQAPDIASEIDFDVETLDPSTISQKSTKKLAWKCSKCNNSWASSVAQRTVYGHGCSRCVLQNNPKVVQVIADLLQVTDVNVKLDDLLWPTGHKFEVDILKEKTVIEYDGDRHHRNKESIDIRKTRALIDAGYRVIRLREGRCNLLDFEDSNFLQVKVKWTLKPEYWTKILKELRFKV